VRRTRDGSLGVGQRPATLALVAEAHLLEPDFPGLSWCEGDSRQFFLIPSLVPRHWMATMTAGTLYVPAMARIRGKIGRRFWHAGHRRMQPVDI